jgi:hypothetical protein
MSQNREIIVKSVADLTETIEELLDDDTPFSEEDCNFYINSLIEENYLKFGLHEDECIYMLNEHIPQSACEIQLTGIKLLIMRQFYKNSKATFIVFNTQKGKTAILIKQIKQIKKNPDLKPVFYIIVSNDKTLADQSSGSIRDAFTSSDQSSGSIQKAVEDCDCEVFTLSSNTKTTFDELKPKIDAYITDDEKDYKTPVIVALANNPQLDKILKLMAHIQFKNIRNHHVKNILMFDEADETYPRIRDKTVIYKDKIESFLGMIDKENRSLEAIYWISATEGELLEGKYAECENAANYVCDEDDLSCSTYRAMHHPSTKFKIVKQLTRESKNGFAFRNIDENDDHFQKPIVLPSGEIYYRKAIINSCSKRSSMVDLAMSLRNIGWHVMIFNQTGLSVYKHGDPVKRIFKTKGHRFNQLCFEKYKTLNLHDRPLAIMGNKKVNRGTSFHYAPRKGEKDLEEPEGLIWTDIILGDISDKNQAVQKAGRGGGRIAHCPQYPENEIYYWTTQNTFSLICTHNSRIDDINKNVSGCNIGDAFKSASERVKATTLTHTVDKSQFRVYKCLEDMDYVVKTIANKIYSFQEPKNPINGEIDKVNGFIYTSLNGPSKIATVFEAINKVNSGYTGQRDANSGGRTVYPCYLDVKDNRTLLYVVLIDNLSVSEKQKQEIADYGKNFEIPQIDTGNLIETLKQEIFGI